MRVVSTDPVSTNSVSAEPLDAAAFAAAMAVFSPPCPQRLGIAVSGGPDSMALAFCLKRWAGDQPNPPDLFAFIVDHGVRDHSAAEAQTTHAALQDLGLTSTVLRWNHPPIISGLQATARSARYRLLTDACHAYDIAYLVLAHQAEDQAETILMRLAKGSGVHGLAGMAAQSRSGSLILWRPFLSLSKERLIATCRHAGIPFVTDPGNSSDRFARGRLRRVMPLLAEEGLTLDRLLNFGQRAAEAKAALDHYTLNLARAISDMDATGAIRIKAAELRQAPRAVAQRLLNAALLAIHPAAYGPEYAALEALLNALTGEVPVSARTLHGCLISKQGKQIIVSREIAAIGETLVSTAGATFVWDQRWRIVIAGPADQPASRIAVLGHQPHTILDILAPGLRKTVPQGRLRAALPALWDGDRLVHIFWPSQKNKHLTARLTTQWPVLP